MDALAALLDSGVAAEAIHATVCPNILMIDFRRWMTNGTMPARYLLALQNLAAVKGVSCG